MKFHIIGKDVGTSLAVAQFVELIRGERPVQAPHNEFRVMEVVVEEHYCFRCFGVRWYDMVRDDQGRLVLKCCRCCGKEGRG